MKVLQITTDYPYMKDGKVVNYGGLGVCVSQLVSGLAERGIEVDVLTRCDKNSEDMGEMSDNVNRTWYFSPTKSRNWKLTHSFTMLPKLVKMLSDNKYDIVHMHNPPAAFMSMGIASRYGVKTLVTMHGPWAKVRDKMQGLAASIEAMTLINSDYVTFDSESLMAEYGNSDRFVAIQNAVDSKKFRPMHKAECREFLGLEPSNITYLYSGRNVYGKNLDTIKKLAEDFPDKGFLIAGTKARMDDFEFPNLKYLGTVSNDTMPLVYGACDAVILDTKAEGMSRAILEAMACRKAVLVSNIPANREAIGTDGFLFDSHEVLNDLVSNLSLADLKVSGYGARERVEEKFDVSSRIDNFIKVYEHIINNG